MKLRVQAGVETYNGTRRTARLTPADQIIDASGDLGGLVLAITGAADMADIQPGDGEVDWALGDASQVTQMLQGNEFLQKLLGPALAIAGAGAAGALGRANLFLRITRADSTG